MQLKELTMNFMVSQKRKGTKAKECVSTKGTDRWTVEYKELVMESGGNITVEVR